MTKPDKKPRRKQTELPGIERPVENEAVEEAAQAYCEIRDQRSALSKKEKLAQMTLLATMHAEKVARYVYLDDNGEELEVIIELGAEKAVVRKTGDAESEIGQGVDTGDAGDESPPPDGGLIAQSLKAQADAGVSESDDGDVVPRDDPPAKKRRKGGGRKAVH